MTLAQQGIEQKAKHECLSPNIIPLRHHLPLQQHVL